MQRDSDLHEALWLDDRHWHLAQRLYFAPRDPRLVVPNRGAQRQRAEHSHTLNFGHWAAYLILALLLIPSVVMVLLALFSTRS